MNTPPAIRIAIWTWFFAALAAGRFAVWQQLPPAAVPGTMLLLAALLVLAYRVAPVFRAWVDGADLRTLVGLHVTRFVGFYFLVLAQRGGMPFAIALPAGIGGIVIAAGALVLVFAPLAPALRLRAIYLWNVVGVADLALVGLNAARIGIADPDALFALTYLPLSLLPSFLFPLILACHVAIFARLSRLRAS